MVFRFQCIQSGMCMYLIGRCSASTKWHKNAFKGLRIRMNGHLQRYPGLGPSMHTTPPVCPGLGRLTSSDHCMILVTVHHWFLSNLLTHTSVVYFFMFHFQEKSPHSCSDMYYCCHDLAYIHIYLHWLGKCCFENENDLLWNEFRLWAEFDCKFLLVMSQIVYWFVPSPCMPTYCMCDW